MAENQNTQRARTRAVDAPPVDEDVATDGYVSPDVAAAESGMQVDFSKHIPGIGTGDDGTHNP